MVVGPLRERVRASACSAMAVAARIADVAADTDGTDTADNTMDLPLRGEEYFPPTESMKLDPELEAERWHFINMR